MTIADLKNDECAIVKKNNDNKPRLLEMGIIPGEKIRFVKQMPFSGPIQLKIRNFYMSIRLEDAKNITIEKVKK